jgi:uncharacterized membrane protein YfcA
MTVGLLLAVSSALFVGTVAQRIAGVGFALLVSPLLAIMLGPREGNIMINVCAIFSCGLIIPQVWRQINWNMLAWLAVPALFGAVAGSLAALWVPPAVLSVAVGAVVILGLLLSLALDRVQVRMAGNAPKGWAGFGSGLTNGLAGVGGPTVSAYAVLSRWPQREFAATLQPFFVQLCVVTLAVKLSLDPGAMPQLAWWMWAVIGLSLTLAVVVSGKVAKLVRDDHARAAVIVMAFLGAAAALAKGLLEL